MNKKYKGKLITRGICVSICILLITTSLVTAMEISRNNYLKENPDTIEILSYSFGFKEPSYRTTTASNNEYTIVDMAGCIGVGKQAGEPMMPTKIVKLLIPPMKTVTNIDIVGTPIEIDSIEKPVFPYQNPVPFGIEPEEFYVNQEVYESSNLYPSMVYDNYHVGYCRGYAILDVTVNPTQYIPNEGKLFYYPELTVTIDLEDTNYVNQFLRNNLEDKAWVEKLVYNPEIADLYPVETSSYNYDGGLCNPDDSYDYVIVTTEHGGLDYWETTGEIPYNWESLMEYHTENDGLSCNLVTVQDIDACEDYHNEDPLFNDQEAHIREFCRDAYQDWSTSYIFVGADAEWIPARLMSYKSELHCDSDLYWSNLDNTFNEDHDNRWGEEGDDGFDLYSELFIGRITCDTPQDVSNWMTKSFYYADNLDADYLDNAAFYGGHLGWECEADDFIDFGAIKGTDDWLGPNPGDHGAYPSWLGFLYGFETWNQEHPDDQYDLSVAWTSEPPNEGWQGGNAIQGLRTAINEDRVAMINGIAHGTADRSLDVSASTWESSYTNTKPFFIHDFGCHCGDMDARDDGVLHSMLFHSDTELAFACIYYTGFGFGSFRDTNSSSALLMKLFNDYLFDLENNSGSPTNWQMGKAMAWAKDAMAPTIDWTYSDAPGSWRGAIQICLLFGDPAQKLKNPHPNLPPEKPTIDGPSEGKVGLEYTYTLVTNDPDEDDVYYYIEWGDGQVDEWVGSYKSGEIAKVNHTWTSPDDYEIRAKAKDTNDAESEWSEVYPVTIVENEPPNAPRITGKTNVKVGVEYCWTFHSEDPNGDQIKYIIDWGDGTTNETDCYPSCTPVEVCHTYNNQGTFVIKAKAKECTQEGLESAWKERIVNVPRNRAINGFFLRFLEQFPILQKILGYIL